MPQAGTNWYNAPGQEELLVWFGTSPGCGCGMKAVLLWSGVEPFTVFSKETLKPGRTVRFVSVLVPHRPQVAAGPLAAGIRAAHGPDGTTTVELPARDGTVRVRLGQDGTWSVSR